MNLTGDTIIRTSNAIRMAYARKLLSTGDMNVTEVASRVGIGDPFYFSRLFKTATGQSPKQWRQSVKEANHPLADGR